MKQTWSQSHTKGIKQKFIIQLSVTKNISHSFLRRIMCNDGIAKNFEFDREVAYSREPNQPKQYVQNLLTRDAAKIYEMWVRYEMCLKF